MKIAIFVGSIFSPVTTFLYRKAKMLAVSGEFVTVVVSGVDQNIVHERLLEDDEHIRIISIPVDQGSYSRRFWVWTLLFVRALWKSPKDIYRFWKVARQYGTWPLRLKSMRNLLGFAGLQSDVVHFEYGHIAVQYIDYVKSIETPSVVSFRGADINFFPIIKEDLNELYRQVIKHVDRVHCVSKPIARKVAQLGGGQKIFVNHPSIDASFFKPSSFSAKEPHLIVSVARLMWKKGLNYALLAMAQLIPEFPDLRYVIVGDGPNKDELLFYIHDLGLQNHVQLYGQASEDEVKNILDKASIFLLSSLEEGLSNAVLEAMSMELPVVTTDAGGMAEAVTNGVEGFVVPRYDSKAIAERIRQLLKDGDLRQQMGRGARQRVLCDFTLERQVQVFLDEYYLLKKQYDDSKGKMDEQ